MTEDGEVRTNSGLPLDPVYLESAARPAPGDFPFTRGLRADGYRSRLWTMRQYAGFGSAEETNQRFHYLLERGQTGLSCAFDLPTQMGYDSDAPLARGEVGKVGVAICSLDDMQTLMGGIPMAEVTTSMTINAPAALLLLLYELAAEGQGIPASSLGGTVQNDILKEYAARGTFIYPAGAVDAAGHRHLRLLRRASAALEPHLDQRLPHPRGRSHGSPGDRLHPGQRHRLRGGGDRAPVWRSTASLHASPSSST